MWDGVRCSVACGCVARVFVLFSVVRCVMCCCMGVGVCVLGLVCVGVLVCVVWLVVFGVCVCVRVCFVCVIVCWVVGLFGWVVCWCRRHTFRCVLVLPCLVCVSCVV